MWSQRCSLAIGLVALGIGFLASERPAYADYCFWPDHPDVQVPCDAVRPQPYQPPAPAQPSEPTQEEKDHQDAQALNDQGIETLNHGDFASAVKLFHEAQDKWPDNAVIKQNLQAANDAADRKIAEIARRIRQTIPKRSPPPRVGFGGQTAQRSGPPSNMGFGSCNGGTNKSYDQLKAVAQGFGVDTSQSGNGVYNRNCSH